MVVRERDDACPGVVDAGPADDGLVLRLRLPGGRIPAQALRALAATAARFGNGAIDVTVRANAQIRAIADADLPRVIAAITDAGLLPSRTHDRVRNILASPLAGRDPRALLDVDPVVSALDEAVCAAPELAALSGRFVIGVDDGGEPIAAPRHDIDLVAVDAGTFALHVAGHDTGRRCDPAGAPDAVVALAYAFLAARAGSGAWHVRELPGGASAFAADLGGSGDLVAPRRGSANFCVGVLGQPAGRFAVGAVVPLGRLTSPAALALADAGRDLRLTAARGVVVRDVADPGAAVAALEAAGLSCDPASPWRGVSACSGLGECRRAVADVRADAAEYANSPVRGPDTHWVGCPRACGSPRGVRVMVARPGGGYDDAAALPA